MMAKHNKKLNIEFIFTDYLTIHNLKLQTLRLFRVVPVYFLIFQKN